MVQPFYFIFGALLFIIRWEDFLVKEATSERPDEENQQAWGEGLAVAIHVLLPLAIAGVLWGRKIILSKILLHLDKACLSVFWPSFSKREKVLKWTMTHLPYLEGGLETIWKDGSQLCTLINSVVPGACPNPHRHWKKPPTHGQALAYKYLGVIPVFTETDFNQKTITSAIEKTLIEYMIGVQQAVSKISHDEELTFSNHYIARGMGLVTGEQYRKTVLYIYPNCQSQQSDNLLINIRGPYNSHGMSVLYGNDLVELYKTMRTGKNEKVEEEEENRSFLKSLTDDFQNLISKKQNREPSCDIEIKIEIEKNRAKIMFIPKNSGVYEVCLTTNGEHIAGSPYNINVEKNRSGIMDDLSEDESKGKSKKRVIPKIIETGPDSKYVYVKYEEKEHWRRQRKVSDFKNSSESSNNTSMEEDICYVTIKNNDDKVVGDDLNNNNDAEVNNLNDPNEGVEENKEAMLQVEVPMKQVLISELNKLKFPNVTDNHTIKSQDIRDRIPSIKGQEIKDRIAKLENQSGLRNEETDGTESKDCESLNRIISEEKRDVVMVETTHDAVNNFTASKKIDVFQKIIDSNKGDMQQKLYSEESSMKTELIHTDDSIISKSVTELNVKLNNTDESSLLKNEPEVSEKIINVGHTCPTKPVRKIFQKLNHTDDSSSLKNITDNGNTLSESGDSKSDNTSMEKSSGSSLETQITPIKTLHVEYSTFNNSDEDAKPSANIDNFLNGNKSQLIKNNDLIHSTNVSTEINTLKPLTPKPDLLPINKNDLKLSTDNLLKPTIKLHDSNSSVKTESKSTNNNNDVDDKSNIIINLNHPITSKTKGSLKTYVSTPQNIEIPKDNQDVTTIAPPSTLKLIFENPQSILNKKITSDNKSANQLDSNDTSIIKKSINTNIQIQKDVPSSDRIAGDVSNVSKRIQRLTNIPKPSILHRGKGLRLNINTARGEENNFSSLSESPDIKKLDLAPSKQYQHNISVGTQKKMTIVSNNESISKNEVITNSSINNELAGSLNPDLMKVGNFNNEPTSQLKESTFPDFIDIKEKRLAFEKETPISILQKPPIKANSDITFTTKPNESTFSKSANPIEETASPVLVPNTETEVLPRNPQIVSDVSSENIKETATTGKGKLRKWKTVDEPEIPVLQITQVDGKTDDENLDLRLSFMKRKEFWHKISSSPSTSLNSSCVSLNFDLNNDRRYNSLSRLQVKKPKLEKRYSLKEIRANNPQQFRSLDFIDKRRIQRSDSWVLRDKYGSLDDLNFPSVKERRGLFLKEFAQPEVKNVLYSKQLKPSTKGLIHKLEERTMSKETRSHEVLQERRPKHFFGSIHDKIRLFDSGFNPGKKKTVKSEEPKENTALKENWERKLNQLPENGTIKTKIKERFEKAQMFFKTLENVKQQHRSDQHFKSNLMRRHSLGSNTIKLEIIKTGGSLRNLSGSERLPLNTLSKDHGSSISLFSSYSSNGDSKYDYEEVKKLQVNLFLLNNKKKERKSIHNVFN